MHLQWEFSLSYLTSDVSLISPHLLSTSSLPGRRGRLSNCPTGPHLWTHCTVLSSSNAGEQGRWPELSFTRGTYRATHQARWVRIYQHNIHFKFQNQILGLWELPHKTQAQGCFCNSGGQSMLGFLPPHMGNNYLWDVEENRNQTASINH